MAAVRRADARTGRALAAASSCFHRTSITARCRFAASSRASASRSTSSRTTEDGGGSGGGRRTSAGRNPRLRGCRTAPDPSAGAR
jgi:hypothetical protein